MPRRQYRIELDHDTAAAIDRAAAEKRRTAPQYLQALITDVVAGNQLAQQAEQIANAIGDATELIGGAARTATAAADAAQRAVRMVAAAEDGVTADLLKQILIQLLMLRGLSETTARDEVNAFHNARRAQWAEVAG